MSAFTVLLRRRKLVVSTLLLSFVTVFLLYTISSLNSNKETLQNYQNSSSYSVIRTDLAPVNIILYWTKYFDRSHFGAGIGSEPFEKGQCSNLIASSQDQTRKCWTTNDRSLFNSSLAVLFHARDIDPDDLPPTAWRRPEQRFIFFNYESPRHTDLARLRLHLSEHFFNLSMTYRLDSDIVILQPYGRLRCIRRSVPGCLDYPFIGKKNLTKNLAKLEQGANYSAATRLPRQKNGTVAWFVSNCRTDSRRELLVRNLSLFIPVDIFGSCKSNKKCGPDRTDCDRMLSRYHFYLSLENSLCPDYVTEKLYRALVHGTIPVVYGGADYTRFLPVGSYVNAVDFSSPQELANRLHQVMNDDHLYASFFQWKRYYRVDSAPLDGWCRLCRLLQSGNNNLKKSYKDIVAWWSGYSANQSCSDPPVSLVGNPPYDEFFSTKSSTLYRLFDRFHHFVIPNLIT